MTVTRVAILCGPPGIFTRTERTCWECKVTGPHVSQWLGYGYGYDQHCLTCRATDQDGHIEPATPGSTAQWDDIVALSLIPTEMFERYVDTDLRGYDAEHVTDAETEQKWAEQMADLAAEVRIHKERTAARYHHPSNQDGADQ